MGAIVPQSPDIHHRALMYTEPSVGQLPWQIRTKMSEQKEPGLYQNFDVHKPVLFH
jgi:hypothetical protein